MELRTAPESSSNALLGQLYFSFASENNITAPYHQCGASFNFQQKLCCRTITMNAPFANWPPHEDLFRELVLCCETSHSEDKFEADLELINLSIPILLSIGILIMYIVFCLQGYYNLEDKTGRSHLRRIRGDNFCAPRAVVFQSLCGGIPVCSRWGSYTEICQVNSQ